MERPETLDPSGPSMLSPMVVHGARVPRQAALDRLAQRLVPVPPLAIAVVLGAVALYGQYLILLRTPNPTSPWDAELFVDAWRVAHGLPVYEPYPQGHAAHIYGPLVSFLQGGIVRLVGSSMLALRLWSWTCALALVALLSTVANRVAPRAPWLTALGVAMLLAMDTRIAYFFAQLRPDVMAALAATVALLVLFRAQRDRAPVALAVGVACVVFATLLKQPFAATAAVPALPLLRDRRFSRAERALWIGAPVAAVLLALVAIRLLFPIAFHFMVQVPGSYRIDLHRGLTGITDYLLSLPLFLALLLWWLVARPPGPLALPWQWSLSAILVAVPVSALTFAKVGGAQNSWLPADLAILFFCLLVLGGVGTILRDGGLSGGRRLAVSATLSLLALLCYRGLKGTFGDRPAFPEYRAVVARVGALGPGPVISPGDPTIELLGRGTAGRNLYVEGDANPVNGSLRPDLPPTMRAELARARYVVTVDWLWLRDYGLLADLEQLGFRPDERLGRYTIWARP